MTISKKTSTKEAEKSCLTKLNNLNRKARFQKAFRQKPCVR